LVLSAGVAAAQTVSVEQLAHHAPAAAAREYRATLKALGDGDLARSIEHCRKAIDADPANAWAHNDLGVLYSGNERYADALTEFRLALGLQPSLFEAMVNASYASLALGRATDAESLARTAIEIRASDRHANLLLGWSLVAQHQYTSAALDSLRIAARDFPEARLAEADVLMHQGSPDAARTAVEAYLATGNVEHRPLAETWLRLLKFE